MSSSNENGRRMPGQPATLSSTSAPYFENAATDVVLSLGVPADLVETIATRAAEIVLAALARQTAETPRRG